MIFRLISALGIFVCSLLAGINIQKMRSQKERQLFDVMQVTLTSWNDFLHDTYSKKEISVLMDRFDTYIKERKNGKRS